MDASAYTLYIVTSDADEGKSHHDSGSSIFPFNNKAPGVKVIVNTGGDLATSKSPHLDIFPGSDDGLTETDLYSGRFSM